MKRILTWSVVAVAVAVIGVLGYGLVVEKIIKARQPVAVVGDTPITAADFQARVRFTRLQMQNELQYWYQQQQMIDPSSANSESYLQYIQGRIRDVQSNLAPENAETIGEQVLNQLIQGALVRQEAKSRGITVTPEEVQEQIETSFGYEPDATPMPADSPPLTSTESITPTAEETPFPTPTRMTEADFRQMYNRYMQESLKPLGVSEEQYRSWVRTSLLTEKLKEQMASEIPNEAEQVKLNLLDVESEEKAKELAARLDAGEEFQTLMEELQGEESSDYGTELDWFPREIIESRLGETLADLAFSLEVGAHSQPVADEEAQRYRVIQVVGREERELEEFVRQRMAEDAFQAWLEAQQVLVERKSYKEHLPTDL